jgi:hypothetical protein
MTYYDYFEEMKNDVNDWIKENINLDEWIGRADELGEYLYETMWTVDSVTGNASGSYTFSTYEAEENLAHNWGLLEEALEVFGQTGTDMLDKGAEWCDVTIRCYLLPQVISAVLEEYEDNPEED